MHTSANCHGPGCLNKLAYVLANFVHCRAATAAAGADALWACTAQASTMQPQHVIAALKELEFAELADEIEAHQREWDAAERPKGAPFVLPSSAFAFPDLPPHR